MFEQSLFNQEPAAEPAPEVQEGDLFHNYELRSWVPSPRIYKILGISAAVNVLALLVFAQTSVLTMKGCDSPLVGSVCQALDVVYVGSMLFGTPREYVDAAYEKTDLANADITYIDVTGAANNQPLSYPEGYFQIANPNEYAMLQQQGINPMSGETPGFPNFNVPGFPTPTARPLPGNSLLNTTPHPPKAKADVVDGDLPSSVNDSGVADSKPGKRRPGNTNANVPDRNPDGSIPGIPGSANTNPTANANTNPTTENGEPLINKRPFVDLANNVNDLLDKNQFKLESAFVVNASGKLNKDGKLDPKTFRYIQAASADPKIIDVVKGSIEAINDSNYLLFLKDLTGKDFNLLLQQDDQNISAVVQSEMESDTRARTIKSSLDFLIGIKKASKQRADADQNDKDDLLLLESAKIEIDGKKVIIKFVIPKQVALPMIQRKLAEAKALPKQPNGNAMIGPNNSTAAK